MRSATLATMVAGALASTCSFAQTESVIWNSNGGPVTSFLFDPNTHTLYGTTPGPKYGTVYSLTERHAAWRHKTLYSFKGGTDAEYPNSGLIEDSAGNFYGATTGGGTNSRGTVFELSPSGTAWNETVLFDFDGTGGAYPFSDLTMDKTTGAIFGTASEGGQDGCGVAFELTQSGGTWSENVLHAFQGGRDGCNPRSRLREDSKGRLYGVTLRGGTYGYGVAFVLRKIDAVWKESLLHSFSDGSDGGTPTDLDLDPTTNTLYGTTGDGGGGNGLVFQLKRAGGRWTETTIYNFAGNSDGDYPVGLHLDLNSGTLYGTTYNGGPYEDGTAFQLVSTGGNWSYKQLHTFGASGDGAVPYARPTVDPNTGYLYGTTARGGTYNTGTAWMIIP